MALYFNVLPFKVSYYDIYAQPMCTPQKPIYCALYTRTGKYNTAIICYVIDMLYRK